MKDALTVLHHDVAPEYFVGLYSREYASTYAALWRLLGTIALSIPLFALLMWINKKVGVMLKVTIRDCPDHAHMLPGLIRYLKRSNFNAAEDFLGRNNGNFYRKQTQEDFSQTNQFLERVKKHGIMV